MRKTFARGRILPRSLSTDPRYGRLSLKARVLYPLIWTSGDDQGRTTGDPDEIKYAVCPNMDDISKEEVPKLLEELQSQGLIKLYSSATRRAIQMLDWWEVQKLQWAWPSEFPPPEGWRDKLRYKKGKKEVVTENWDGSGESSPEQDEVTVSPESSAEGSPESSGDISVSPENTPESSPEISAESINDAHFSPESSPEIPASGRGIIKNQELNINSQKSKIKNQESISPESSGESPGEKPPPEGGLPGKGLFENLLEQIRAAPNHKAAISRVGEVYQICAGRAPPYDRIGVVARRSNYDFGLLAKLIWESAGMRPAGELLDYVEGILRRSKFEQNTGQRTSAQSREDFGGESW